MKKLILLILSCVLILQGIGFAKTIEPVSSLKRASLQTTFYNYGLDLERNFMLVSEKLGYEDR